MQYLSAEGPEVQYLSAEGPEVQYLSAARPEVQNLLAVGPEMRYILAERPHVQHSSAERPQVCYPSVERPQVWNPSVERLQMQHPLAERPQMQYPLAERPQMRYQSAERPQMRHQSAERPQMRYQSAERPQMRYQSAERLQMQYQSAERPQMRYQLAERPQMRYPSAERLQVRYPSAERLQVQYPLAERPQVQYPLAERPQVQYLLAERPQMRYPSAEMEQVRYPSAEREQVWYPSAERSQVQYPSVERPQVQYPSAERPPVRYISAERPQVQYLSAEKPDAWYPSADKSEERYLSVEEPGMLCQKKTGGIIEDHNQTKFDSPQQQLTANQWPVSIEHSKQMRDVSKMVKQNNIPQQKIGANRHFQSGESMHYEETQNSFPVNQRGMSNPMQYQYGQSKQDKIPSCLLRPNAKTSPKDHHLIRKRVEMRPVENNEIVGRGRQPNVTIGALPQLEQWYENRMNNKAKTLVQLKSSHTGIAPLVRVDVPPTDESQHTWPGKSFVASGKPIIQSRQDIFPGIIKKPTSHYQMARGRSLDNLTEPAQYNEQYALASSVENLSQASSTEALEQWYKEKKKQNIVAEMASRAKVNTRRYSTDNLLMPSIHASHSSSQNKLCSSMISLREPDLNTASQAKMVNIKMQSMDNLSEPSKMNNERMYLQNSGNTGHLSGNFGRITTAKVQNYYDENATNSTKGTDHSTVHGKKREEPNHKARGNKMPSKNADYYEQGVLEKVPAMREVESRFMPSIPPRTTFHDECPQNQLAYTKGPTENPSGLVQEQYTRMKPEESPGRYFGEKHHVQFMDYRQEYPGVGATSKEACEQVVNTQYEHDFKEIRYQDTKKSTNYLDIPNYVEQKLAAGNDPFYPVQQRSSQTHNVESLPSEENSHCTRSTNHYNDANSQSDNAYSTHERAFSEGKPKDIHDVNALHNVPYEDLRSTTSAHTLKLPVYDPLQRSDGVMKLHHTQQPQDVHSGIPEAPVPTLGMASTATLPPPAEEIPSMHRWAVYAAMGEFYKLKPLVDKNITILFMKDSLSGYTALHWAAKHGFVDALTWMGKKAQSGGILLPVDVRSNGAGLTALHLAAAHGRDDAIRVLVHLLHANPSLRDYGGRKALHYLPLEMVSLQARQLLETSPVKMFPHVPRKASQPIKTHDQNLLSFFKPPKSPRCPRK
uniref:uncharacterized protein n=1 Tax=Myxine glutinosa TaxID=7769 RepID=UPI00359016F9